MTRPSPRLLAGLLCVVAGLVLLGYVGWQLWGTNWQSAQKREGAVGDLRDRWEGPPGARGDGPGRAVPAAAGEAYALVRVPAFGADYEVPVLEGVSDDVLATGLGHFPGSADPGGRGNFALAGHRITHGEPLADLPLLEPGDEVVVETGTHVWTYRLDTDPEELVVDLTDGWVVSSTPQNPDPAGVGPADEPRLLTLTTCAELFHTDDRMVAFAHLVDSEVKDGLSGAA